MPNVKTKDLDAEKSVIAGLLRDPKKIDQALLNSNGKFFTEALYRNLFKIITQTYIKHGSTVTNDLVSNYLESSGVEQAQRLVYLKELDQLADTAVNDAEFAFAIKSLKKAFIASAVSDILTAGTQVLDGKGGVQAYKTIDKMLYDLKLSTIDADYLNVVDIRQVEDLIERFKDIRENPEKYKGIPTGWMQLDAMTAGFQAGEYVLIIAKSGGGKSMGLINWADYAQLQGYNVAYVTLEMSHIEVRLRQLSLTSGIPYLSLKTQSLTVEQLQKQEDVLRNNIATRTGAFYIVDVPKCSVGFIEAQLRQLQQNMKIDIVFVDYLGLLKPEAHIKNRQGWEVLASISNDLRELARTMKTVVVSAHQITTEGQKKTAEDDLDLADISLSRAIANPAHAVVGLIWDKQNPSDMKLCVPKCRGGRIASARLWCDLDTCTIKDAPAESLLNDNDLEVPDISNEPDEPQL
jgi:replicative DNA helicase